MNEVSNDEQLQSLSCFGAREAVAIFVISINTSIVFNILYRCFKLFVLVIYFNLLMHLCNLSTTTVLSHNKVFLDQFPTHILQAILDI